MVEVPVYVLAGIMEQGNMDYLDMSTVSDRSTQSVTVDAVSCKLEYSDLRILDGVTHPMTVSVVPWATHILVIAPTGSLACCFLQ